MDEVGGGLCRWGDHLRLQGVFSLLADEFFDGPDEWVENPPFDFLEDIADGSFIV